MNKIENTIILILAIAIAIAMLLVYGLAGVICISIPYTILYTVNACMEPDSESNAKQNKCK